MKKILLTTLISFSLINVNAQEKAIAKIHYIFKHVNDTTQRDKQIRDEVVTYLGQHTSYYTSYFGTRIKEETAKQIEAPGFNGNLVVPGSMGGIKESFLLAPAKAKLIEVRRVAANEFIWDVAYPKQNWNIEEDTKVIGGYTCHKATATFGGRAYTAWFTIDLPFPFGPWKLHGLPGLILAAEDDKGEVVFEYSGFDKLAADVQYTIETPAKGILSTKEAVEKLENVYKSSSKAFMQTKSGGSSAGSKVGVFVSSSGTAAMPIDGSKIKSMTVKNDEINKPSSVTNNPLELKP